MRRTYERAIAEFEAREGGALPAGVLADRRSAPSAQYNAGRRSSDVALVTHGEVAFLTFEGFLETAASLAEIVLFLAARERDDA